MSCSFTLWYLPGMAVGNEAMERMTSVFLNGTMHWTHEEVPM